MRKRTKTITLVAVLISSSLLMYLAVGASSQYGHGRRNDFLKVVWFETGLLHSYSVQSYLSVITQFNFNAVGVEPFPITPESLAFCDVISAYASSNGLTKFLIVGTSLGVDWDLVAKYKNTDYIMSIDDSGVASTANLEKLKALGCQTMLVCWYDEALRPMFARGLVNYACFCYYPYYPSRTDTEQFDNMVRLGKLCIETNVNYLPAIQCFGMAGQTWRFPTPGEIGVLCENSSIYGHATGLIYFTPFTGQSTRGEYFEGWMDHYDVWNGIKYGVW